MKPAARFLVVGLASVAVLTAAAAFCVVEQTTRSAQPHVIESLKMAAAAEAELQAGRSRELQLRADLTAHDPAFVDYIAQSLIPNPKFGGGVDTASINDLLGERHEGFDVAMVLDPAGKVVATSGTLLRDDTGIQHEPVVMDAISTRKPAQGAWVDHGKLVLVSANPLIKDGTLQGVLLAATQLGGGFTNAIRRIVRTDVVLIVPSASGPAMTTSEGVESWVEPVLTAQIPQVLSVTSATGDELKLSDSSHSTTAWVSPLGGTNGHAVLVALDPNHDDQNAIQDDAMPLLWLVALLGAIAAATVLLQWRRTYIPLQRMLDIIDRAAAGDEFLTVRSEGSPIVLYMRDTVNRLLQRYKK